MFIIVIQLFIPVTQLGLDCILKIVQTSIAEGEDMLKTLTVMVVVVSAVVAVVVLIVVVVCVSLCVGYGGDMCCHFLMKYFS